MGVYKYARMGYPLFANKITGQICIWIAARVMLSTRLLSSQEKIHDQPGRDTDHDQWLKIWIRGIRPMIASAATHRMQSEVNEEYQARV